MSILTLSISRTLSAEQVWQIIAAIRDSIANFSGTLMVDYVCRERYLWLPIAAIVTLVEEEFKVEVELVVIARESTV